MVMGWRQRVRGTPRLACGRRAGVGRVLSSVAAGHPGGTRSALDRFRETSIVDRRVRGDVPPHPLPSGERLFLDLPPDEGDSPYAAGVRGGSPVLHLRARLVCSLGWDDQALSLAFYSLGSSLICPSRSRSAPAGGKVVLKPELAQIGAHHLDGG